MLNNHQIQVILSSISEAMMLVNTEGIIIVANNSVKTLLNLSPKNLLGQSLVDLSTDDLNRLGLGEDGQAMVLYQLKTGDQAARIPYSEYQAADDRFIRRTHILIFDAAGQVDGLLMKFTDETELHQVQDEITSMIVHDIRSPLTAVTASLRLLRELAEADEPLTDVVLQTTDISGRALRKILVLVNSMLDMSKLTNGAAILEQDWVDIGKLIRSVKAELTPLAREMEVFLEVNSISDLPLIDIDPDKIERVLYNLIDNAIKFTPEDGQVTISADECTEKEQRFLRIKVADTGYGIPNDQKDLIFNRFQQVSGGYARRRGTGLGLTYCKLTIEAHGGRIWIEDNPVGGSVFIFTLPLTNLD